MKLDREATTFAVILALASPALRREIIAALYEACSAAGVKLPKSRGCPEATLSAGDPSR